MGIVPQITLTALEYIALWILLFQLVITVCLIRSEEIVIHKQMGVLIRTRFL